MSRSDKGGMRPAILEGLLVPAFSPRSLAATRGTTLRWQQISTAHDPCQAASHGKLTFCFSTLSLIAGATGRKPNSRLSLLFSRLAPG